MGTSHQSAPSLRANKAQSQTGGEIALTIHTSKMRNIFFTWTITPEERTDCEKRLTDLFASGDHPIFGDSQFRIQLELGAKSKKLHFQGAIILAVGKSITFKEFFKLIQPQNVADLHLQKIIKEQSQEDRAKYMLHYCSKPVYYCGCKHCINAVDLPDKWELQNCGTIEPLVDVRVPEAELVADPKDIMAEKIKNLPIKRANTTVNFLLNQAHAKQRK